MFSSRSLIYSKNNKGPSTEPWGTPEFTAISVERSQNRAIPSVWQAWSYDVLYHFEVKMVLRPGWQAGLMIVFFFRTPFENADSQYQLCPYFELPNYQNLASVGMQWLVRLILSFWSGKTELWLTLSFILSIHTGARSLEDYEQVYILHIGFAGWKPTSNHVNFWVL